jgi:hypothetical protein
MNPSVAQDGDEATTAIIKNAVNTIPVMILKQKNPLFILIPPV